MVGAQRNRAGVTLLGCVKCGNAEQLHVMVFMEMLSIQLETKQPLA